MLAERSRLEAFEVTWSGTVYKRVWYVVDQSQEDCPFQLFICLIFFIQSVRYYDSRTMCPIIGHLMLTLVVAYIRLCLRDLQRTRRVGFHFSIVQSTSFVGCYSEARSKGIIRLVVVQLHAHDPDDHIHWGMILDPGQISNPFSR